MYQQHPLFVHEDFRKVKSMNEEKVIIRDYKKGDEDGIIELMSPYWKHLASKENWYWEYTECPEGHALIKVAEHRGKIVGHYALFPLEMKCGDVILKGAKAEGSVVHPNYRGNVAKRFFPEEKDARIFNKLIKRTLNTAEEFHIDLIWGFPNEIALKPQVRAGYHHMRVPLCHMILPIDKDKSFNFLLSPRIKNKSLLYIASMLGKILYKLSNLLRFSRKLKRNFEVTVEELSGLDEKMGEFWERYSQENKCITIKRDKKYLMWRFVCNPVVQHKIFVSKREKMITGYIVVNIIKEGKYLKGNIVDILNLKQYKEDLELLIERAISFFKEKNVDFVMTEFSKKGNNHEMYQSVLVRHRFFSLPKRYLNVIVKVGHSLNMQEFIFNPNNWHITTAFTEGVS